jgi:hypothetical protein
MADIIAANHTLSPGSKTSWELEPNWPHEGDLRTFVKIEAILLVDDQDFVGLLRSSGIVFRN